MPNRTACETTIHTDGTFDTIHRPFTEQEEAAANTADAIFAAEKPARAMAELRTERNVLLDSSDWTQGPDSPLDDTKDDWATYRQELRDLPATTDDPTDVTWPTPPE